MKNSTIAWILVAVFSTTSILFACLYLSERHSLQRTQAALDMTEKSEAELRSNVQAAIAQSDKQESKAVAQDKVNAVCGIYYFEKTGTPDQKLDIRSDGTAVFSQVEENGYEFNVRKMKWDLNGETVTIGDSTSWLKFTIEQDDLIDSRGNRWIHTR